MVDNLLYEIVVSFRGAILAAKEDGCFAKDFSFSRFPNGCCGDTSYLLAEYLQTKGFKTIYVWGVDNEQSHAWLVLKDHRIKEPSYRINRSFELPDDIKRLIASYSGESPKEDGCQYDNVCYIEKDLEEGIIIDITADQFGEAPIFIGFIDDFHKQFNFRDAHDCYGLNSDNRRQELYSIIQRYL